MQIVACGCICLQNGALFHIPHHNNIWRNAYAIVFIDASLDNSVVRDNSVNGWICSGWCRVSIDAHTSIWHVRVRFCAPDSNSNHTTSANRFGMVIWTRIQVALQWIAVRRLIKPSCRPSHLILCLTRCSRVWAVLNIKTVSKTWDDYDVKWKNASNRPCQPNQANHQRRPHQKDWQWGRSGLSYFYQESQLRKREGTEK